jgi:flagellar basal body-associated protein FliL
MKRMSILWIVLIVVLVLALLGFFSRGYLVANKQ